MNKTALITGASRGIGAAIALQLAKDGFTVFVNYNSSKDSAEKIAAQANGFAIKADVSDAEQVNEMLEIITKQTGGVDVLVNKAGVSVKGLFNNNTSKQEEKLWGINVQGVFNCTKAVLPHMINQKCGKIINISSMWGQVGASCEVHYSASKAAVIGFTKALAQELGPSGINVNCIAPGVIMTDMNKEHSQETMEILKDETPLGKIGIPEDIAHATAFLASDKSDFITGQVLGVNGGFVI